MGVPGLLRRERQKSGRMLELRGRAMTRWIRIAGFFAALTLIAIAVSDAFGVGHRWPALAIGIPFMATAISAAVLWVKMAREQWP